MCASGLCEREEETQGLGDMEEVLQELKMPEMDEEEVQEVVSMESEVEMEDEGVEMEIVEEVGCSEDCSSSRMILSSTSPRCSCSTTSLIFWANSDLAPFLSS